jgi:hypothetical protein
MHLASELLRTSTFHAVGCIMTLEDLRFQGTDSCQYLLFWTRDGRSLARGRNVADSSRVMIISAGSARRDVRATATSIRIGWQKCHSLNRVPGGEANSTRYDVIVVGAGHNGLYLRHIHLFHY